ncbi:MAG: energy transducer TonB [Sphingobacteriaceae bacterium]
MRIVLWFICCLTGGPLLWAQQEQIQEENSIRQVDVIPRFPTGGSGWQNYLGTALDLSDALEKMDSAQYIDFGARQTAILEFRVYESGKVGDVQIINESDISPAFAHEARRVMERSPKWLPARKDNQPVVTRIRQSITAVLD